MPNTIAYLALAASPFFVAILAARLPADLALIWSMLLCYLFLPELPAALELPLAPPLGKQNLPLLAAFFALMYFHRPAGPFLPVNPLARALVVIFVAAPVVTTLTNSEPVVFGLASLPPMAPKDAVSMVVSNVILLLPFLLARQYLATEEALTRLLRAFMIGGLIYIPFMLIEIRMSPQLNNWIYGYYQHLFSQTVRSGGYRPVVFLYHGLWTAFYILTATISAYALFRWTGRGGRPYYLAVAVMLTVTLVLAKSLGALIFLVLLIPPVLFVSPGTQVRIAMVIGLLTMSYPILKDNDLVPEAYVLSQIAKIDAERAGSLGFRFENERILLDRADEKPLFGWGSWGRNHIHDPYDGRILTVTDGFWIITIGSLGWLGFLSEFGLLILPPVLLWLAMRRRYTYEYTSRIVTLPRKTTRPRRIHKSRSDVTPLVGPLCLLLAFNVLDLLPNATLTVLTWMVAGALTGYAESLRVPRAEAKAPEAAIPARRQTIL